jgi:cell division protein FtsB
MDNLFYRRKHKAFDIGGFVRKIVRNKRLVLAIVIGVPLTAYLAFGNRGVLQRVRLQQQKAELEIKIREAETETRVLQAESKALDGDRKAIEKVARERYGMVRDGEKIYKVNRKQ